MHAGVLADHASLRRHQFPASVFRRNPLLPKIRIDERRVVAVRNETDLLAVRLRRGRNPQLAGQFAYCGLLKTAQRKQRAGKLLLLQAEKKIGLVLGAIRAAPHLPSPAVGIPRDPRVVPRCYALRAHAFRHFKKLVELDEVVAQRARNRRTPGKILLDERLHHLRLEPLLEVHDVIRNAQMLRHVPRVVHIVERATAPGRPVRRKLRQPPLVPELHGEPDYALALALQHSRDNGAVHPARHRHGNRSLMHKQAPTSSTSRHSRRPRRLAHPHARSYWIVPRKILCSIAPDPASARLL